MTLQPEDIDAFVKAAVVRNLERCGIKHEVLALLMGITGPQFSAQLRPGGHVSMTRLLRASNDPDGARFLQAFWRDVAEFVGIEDMDAVASELRRFHGRLGWVMDKIQVRMAKAEIRAIETKKRIA